MAWAWNADTLASAESKFTVSDRLRMRLAAPRSMAPGETASLSLQAQRLDGPEIKQVSVDILATPPLALADPAPSSGLQACDAVTDRARCQRKIVTPRNDGDWNSLIQIHAGPNPGLGEVRIQYRLDGEALDRSWKVPVSAPLPRITQLVAQQAIPPRSSKTFGRADFDNMVAGFDASDVVVVTKLSRTIASPDVGQFFRGDVTVRQLDQLAHQAQLLLVAKDAGSQAASSPSDDEIGKRLEGLVREISVLQASDGGFVSDGQMARHFQKPGRPYQIKSATVGETAFALDVLSRATKAGVSVPSTAIDRGVGFLLSALQSIVSEGAKCTRSDRYALAVLARMDRIASGSLRAVANLCMPNSSPVDKIILATAYDNFGFGSDAKAILADLQIDQNPLPKQNPAGNAQAIALLIESRPDIDPQRLFSKIGLTAGFPYDLATASWVSRASRAALDLLKPNSSAQTIAVAPAGLIGRSVSDGLELKALQRSALPDTGVQITNIDATPLVASFLANGVPRQITAANNSVFDLKLKINTVMVDPDKPIVVKQFDKVYFEVELNQRDHNLDAQRLALFEILPTGFEGMDKIIEPGWAGVLGAQIDLKKLSEVSYSEFQSGRWVATLPSSEDASNPQLQHRLGFSATPLLAGEFILPPLMVRDLNQPGRVGWTKPGKVIVRPSN
jgi:uncharacterized protein YfaS (alpha-2-macroglobulin family)